MADTADNRSVHTDALATLGTIIGEGEARDAIHLAVEPAVAGEYLYPGMHVGLRLDGRAAYKGTKHVGIVDPFLPGHVEEGQRFWLIVYPRQIRSLRHVWEHPDFPPAPELALAPPADNANVEASRAWITRYVEDLNASYSDEYDGEYGYGMLSYDELIEAAKTHIAEEWEYLQKGPLLDGVSTLPEFWDHFSVVTGIDVPSDKRGSFFTCTC
jgi:hypothetical protein